MGISTGPLTSVEAVPSKPSKKNDTGTPSDRPISQSREALTRFIPVSYFWICWNLIPTFSANCC
jgi:hypothetical protein